MRESALLYALFLVPTILWFLYGGASDAELSRHIGDAWQATFWHMPGLSNLPSRWVLDGLEWIVIGFLTGLFWKSYCVLKTQDETTIRQIVLRWTIVCSVLLLAVIPFHSSDLYGYLNRGFQQSVFHTNPYLTPIVKIPNWQQEPLLHAHWQYNPCPYGFFFAQWAFWLTRLTHGHFVFAFLLMKLTNVFFLLGTVCLVAQVGKQLGQTRPWLSAFLLGANPLVLLHVMGNGHNDILMMFLLLLALYCLNSSRVSWLTLPLLMLSVLTKYASLLAVPFILIYLIQQRNWKAVGFGGLVSLLLMIALGMPYVDLSQHWPWSDLLDNAGKPQHSIADMLARMIYYPVKWLKLADAKDAMQMALTVIKPVFWGGFALLFFWQCFRFVRQKQTFASLNTVIALVMVVMVAFVSVKFHPWYVVMFLPLALILPENNWLRRFGIWFSVFQIAGFTLLQNVHILNALFLTLIPLWLSVKNVEALPCSSETR